MAIHAVVFDIGGVLEITPDPQLRAMTSGWEERLHLTSGAMDERLGDLFAAGSLGGCSEEDVYAGMRDNLGMDEAQLDAYKRDFWAAYLGELNGELVAYFASLRPRYQTALLSNSFVGAREREQDAYSFAQICDDIIYSHEVGLAKPDPRIYALTCERLGRLPEEIVFLDDYEPCIAGARAYGMRGVLFQNTAQAIADIQALLTAPDEALQATHVAPDAPVLATPCSDLDIRH
jgi:putative hydrolase of the HAD superfamily